MVTRQDRSAPGGVSEHRPAKNPSNDAVAARRRKADAALSMSLSGATWGEIAETLGFATPRQARTATERALIRQLERDDDREKMRAMAGARLERLLRGIWTKAINPEDPEQMIAVSRSRELIADHSKLFGLNAPTELMVHSPTQSELEDWVLRMTATMVPEVVEEDIYDAEVVSESQDPENALPA
jgi:hypothetical protein